MAVRIKLRYDTYANWNSNAGTLAQGELGLVEYSDGRIDIHAGTDPTPQLWSSCPIVNEGVTTLSGLTDVNLTDLENGDILVYSDGSWIASGSTGSGEVVRAQSPIITGTLNVEDLVLSGNLTVNGTTTTINTTTLTVDDINIELGSTTDPDDDTANNGGITLKGSTDKTFNWIFGTTSWTSSENLDLVSGKEYKINGTGVLKSDALGSGLFLGANSTETPQNADRLLIYHTGNWSSWITWENLKSGLEAAISGVDVDLTMPSGIFTVAKDIDTDGTNFDVTFDNQSVNTIFAGPSVGSGQPTFRELVPADIPNLDFNKITTGNIPVNRGGTGQTSYTNGELLIGNTTGNTLAKATLTAGTGISVTNGEGSISIALIGQALALHTLGTNGIIVKTGSDAVAARTISSGTGISISNGTGVSGDPTISLNANLDNLLDVSITNVSGGNILVYDETDGWINTDVIYGGNAASFT